MDNELDISGVTSAVNMLQRILNTFYKYKDMDEAVQEGLRAGVIQSFEFSYELCGKMMKRWLEINVNVDTIDGLTRYELFRKAGENRLIADVEAWFEFHKLRNLTTHTYDEKVAENVLEAAKKFLPHAQDFLERLGKRL